MNNGKSIDETEALPLAESAGSLATNNSDAQEFNLRRRRLIRGAAGLAPVVLTLRSGALAAASSCTAALALNVTLEDGSPNTAAGKVPASVLGAVQDDPCYSSMSTSSCPTGRVRLPANQVGTVKSIAGNNAAPFYCSNTAPGQTVSILSIAAASSLINT